MKGLILNNIYSAASNLRIYVIIVIVTGGFSLWTSNNAMTSFQLLISLLTVPLGCIFICIQKCNFSKWNRLEIVFPMARRTIVLAQYSTYVLFLLLGLVLSLAFVVISGTYLIIILPLLASSILTGAIFFPLTYKFADDKLYIIMLGSVVASVAILLALTVKISTASEIMPLAVAIIAFVCSYFISVRIYSKKDM